jgi:hypothetical protein
MAGSLEYGRISFEFAEEVNRLSDPDEVANAIRRIMTPLGLNLVAFFARVPGQGERWDTTASIKHTRQIGIHADLEGSGDVSMFDSSVAARM